MHHHLIREKTRTRCGLIIESGEPREVQHFALLTAYGAGAINPYLALATLDQLLADGYIADSYTLEKLHKKYHQGRREGLAKGDVEDGHLDAAELSRCADFRGHRPEHRIRRRVLHLDRPAESRASGSKRSPKKRCAGTSTLIPRAKVPETLDLDVGGQYQWRRKGEAHLFNPEVVAKLQHATRLNSREDFVRILPGDRRSAATTADPARAVGIQAGRAIRFRSTRSSRRRESSSVSPPAPCRTARSRRKRTRRWPSP